MRSTLKSSAFAMVILITAAQANAQTSLRWRWEKGRKLSVAFEQNTRTTTTVNKRPLQMNIDSKMEATWSVVNVDSDGGATIEQTIERMTLSLKTPEKPALEFDSNDKRHPIAVRPTADAVAPLLNAPIRIEVASNGEIKSVQLDEKAEAAFKASAAGSGVPALFTKAGFTSVVRQTAPRLPDKQVMKGDSWKTVHEFDSAFGSMQQTNTYELSGPQTVDDRKVEQISISGELKVLQAKEDAKGEFKSQTLTGQMLFDPTSGLVRSSKVTQRLATERPFRGTVIKVDSLSTLKMTLTESR